MYLNLYGFLDLLMCFWLMMFKKGGFKFWVQFIEKYGLLMLVGKYLCSVFDGEKNLLFDCFEDMVQDVVVVVLDDFSIEIKEVVGKIGSVDVYECLLYFCCGEVLIVLFGQN